MAGIQAGTLVSRPGVGRTGEVGTTSTSRWAGSRGRGLARRTVEAVHKEFPGVRCVWGFSNTTFFHTPVDHLPPGTNGQSYHP